MSDPPTPGQLRFGAWLLIVIGGLMAMLCGGCTLTLWIETAREHQDPATAIQSDLFFLVIGGTPTAVGAYLTWSGIRDLRASRTPPSPE